MGCCQLIIELDKAIHCFPGIEMFCSENVCLLSHSGTSVRIAKECDQRIGQTFDVSFVNQKAGSLMLDDVRDPTNTSRHDRQATGQRFHYAIRCALSVARQAKQAGLAHQVRNHGRLQGTRQRNGAVKPQSMSLPQEKPVGTIRTNHAEQGIWAGVPHLHPGR